MMLMILYHTIWTVGYRASLTITAPDDRIMFLNSTDIRSKPNLVGKNHTAPPAIQSMDCLNNEEILEHTLTIYNVTVSDVITGHNASHKTIICCSFFARARQKNQSKRFGPIKVQWKVGRNAAWTDFTVYNMQNIFTSG